MRVGVLYSRVKNKLYAGSFVFSASLLNALANTALSIILARAMPVEEYGYLSSSLAVMLMVGQLVDSLFNTGMVTLGANAFKAGASEEGHRILDSSFWVKSGIGIIVAVVAVAISRPLAPLVFGRNGMAWAVPLVFFGALALMVISHQQSALQSMSSFRALALNSVLVTGIKVGLVLSALSAWRTTGPLLTMYALAAVLGAGLGFSFTRPVERWGPPHRPVLKDVLELGRWVAVSAVVISIISRIDILMLNRLTTAREVAEYAAANQLAYFFPVINNTVATVLLPAVATYTSGVQIRTYIKSVLRMVPLVVTVCAIAVIAASSLVPLVLGAKYASAVPVFAVLAVAYSISLLVNPLSLPFYATKRPQTMTIMNCVQLIVGVALNFLFIPRFGAAGAAIAVLTVRLLALVWVLLSLARLLRQES